MAISFIGSNHTSVTSGAAVTVTLPGLVEGDLVVAFGGHANSGSDAGVSTAGYTEIVDHSFSGDRQSVSYKFMGSTPDTTVTCHGSTVSGKGAVYAVMCFRGVDSASPIDATTTVTSGNGSPNSPSITTATNSSAVLSLVLSEVSDSTVTAPTGYGDQINGRTITTTDVTVGGAWINKATAGAEDPAAWSTFTSGDWLSATVALKPLVLTVSDAVFAAAGISSVSAIGDALGDLTLTATGTATVSFVGLNAEGALLSNGAATVSFAGDYFGNDAAFVSAGTATGLFVGAADVTNAVLSATATSTVAFAATGILDNAAITQANGIVTATFIGEALGRVRDIHFHFNGRRARTSTSVGTQRTIFGRVATTVSGSVFQPDVFQNNVFQANAVAVATGLESGPPHTVTIN